MQSDMNKQTILIGSIKAAPLGEVWAALSLHGLVTVEFGISQASFERTVHKQMKCDLEYAPKQVDEIVHQIKEYLIGKRRKFELAIDWSVPFLRLSADALKRFFFIPYGELVPMRHRCADRHPQAFRAMGRANATNPMPLVIPCHRVIGTDGKLHAMAVKAD